MDARGECGVGRGRSSGLSHLLQPQRLLFLSKKDHSKRPERWFYFEQDLEKDIKTLKHLHRCMGAVGWAGRVDIYVCGAGREVGTGRGKEVSSTAMWIDLRQLDLSFLSSFVFLPTARLLLRPRRNANT